MIGPNNPNSLFSLSDDGLVNAFSVSFSVRCWEISSRCLTPRIAFDSLILRTIKDINVKVAKMIEEEIMRKFANCFFLALKTVLGKSITTPPVNW